MNFPIFKKLTLGIVLTCAISGSMFGFYSILEPVRDAATTMKVITTAFTALGLANGAYHIAKTDKLPKEAKVTAAAALLCLDLPRFFKDEYRGYSWHNSFFEQSNLHIYLILWLSDLCKLNGLRLVANFIYDRAEKAYEKIAGKADEEKPVTDLEAA